MSWFFGSDDDAIGDDYFRQAVPEEGWDLFERSIEASPTWDTFSAEEQAELADMYGDAIVSGSFDEAEDFLFFLDIEWDDDDIADFWEAYESLAG